ncbi:MAG TPA: hypothetical protein VGB54_05930 [Allosphingosinicella sp.]
MSRKLIPLLLGVAAITATPASAGPRLSPEAQIERALEGRVAGEPVDCVNLRDIRNSRVIDGTAILFDAGGTIYLNRPRAGADSLDRADVQLVRTHTSRLCSIDTIQMLDAGSRILTGNIFLGEFVPYRRVRTR